MKIYRKKKIFKKIIFIDGLPGSGKSLVAPIISSLNKNDLWTMNHIYEYIIFLFFKKKISLDAAKSLLKLYADLDIYNLSLGRNVNFRAFDDSSVQKNLFLRQIKKRQKQKNIQNQYQKI